MFPLTASAVHLLRGGHHDPVRNRHSCKTPAVTERGRKALRPMTTFPIPPAGQNDTEAAAASMCCHYDRDHANPAGETRALNLPQAITGRAEPTERDLISDHLHRPVAVSRPLTDKADRYQMKLDRLQMKLTVNR